MASGTPEHRFWLKVDKGDGSGCWMWTGAKSPLGYGAFRVSPRDLRRAHRYSYELLVGPIPEGLHIDHLCRVPSCVRPDHLEPVTLRENTARGTAWQVIAERHRAITRCPRGHEYDEQNTRRDRNGKRSCRECSRANKRKHWTGRSTCKYGHLYTSEIVPGRHRRCEVCAAA